MIVIGALVAIWGAVVIGLSGTLHRSWKGMLADMRRSGVRNTIPGTKLIASEEGLRRVRIAGAVAVAAGLAAIAAGLLTRG